MKAAPRLSLLRLAFASLPLFATATVFAADAAPAAPAASDAAAPTATPADDKTLPLPIEEVRIFAQVLNQVRSSYVEPIDDQTLLENAIRGMLAYIDPHST